MTRFLVWGIPAALVVTAVTLCDFKLHVPRSKAMLLLGNASYALYLTHLFPLGAVRFVWPKLPEFIRSSDILLIASSVGAALFVGVGFYFLVEKPLITLGKRVTVHISNRTVRG
jgi:peptidoglycan/LPS O-acetylase OafA/YrhL